jgi:hypothetical protein
MSAIAEVLGRISLAESELSAVRDLVVVNDNPTGLPITVLAQSICGKNLRYKLENLIIHLWSAKDYMSSELEASGGKGASSSFERRLLESKHAHLIQYLANKIKHSKVTRLRKNIYLDARPSIGTPYVFLTNNSVVGRMKPVARFEGEVISSFSLEGPLFKSADESSVGFDTIVVSAKVVAHDGRVISGAYETCREYSKVLNELYDDACQGCAQQNHAAIPDR